MRWLALCEMINSETCERCCFEVQLLTFSSFCSGVNLQSKVEMVVPMVIGDYTDFFASMHHAKNCGLMFRGPQNAINPNWYG